MDEDDEYIRLNGNDAEAQRLLAIALEFENATQPLTSSYIQKNFYGDCPTAEAARKAFSRDRKKLVLCGVNIIQGAVRGDEKTWLIDADSSYASVGSLSAEDALILDLACAPLADDPNFPYANDLRVALSKIDRSFESGTPVRISESSRNRSSRLAILESAAADRVGVEVQYRKPNGKDDERLLGILGFFSLRGNTYIVAIRLDANTAGSNTPAHTPAHVYNVSRILAAKVRKTTHYNVPEDFDIRDFVRLPFQLGPTLYTARFAIPKNRESDLVSASYGRGSFESADSNRTAKLQSSALRIWKVSVSSEEDAAAWAVSLGIKPIAPQSLVQSWHHLLAKASESFDAEQTAESPAEQAAVHSTESAMANDAVTQTNQGRNTFGGTSEYTDAVTGNIQSPDRNTKDVVNNTRHGIRNTHGKGRKDAVDEARDLVSLLGALAQKGDTVTIDAISNRMGVSKEHAQKLLLLLSSASGEYGTPLTVFQNNDDELTIAFDHATVGRPLRLTKSESIALEAALNYLHLDLNDPFRKRVEKAYVSGGVSAKEVAQALAPADTASNAAALPTITHAIAQQSHITFMYQGSADAVQKSRLVRPIGLRRGDAGWYLDAYDLNRRGERTFRVERMDQVNEVGDATTSSPANKRSNESKGSPSRSSYGSTPITMPVEPEPNQRKSKARRVTLTFHDSKSLSLFEWPGLHIVSQNSGCIMATIPYYASSSMWLPRHLAACGGKVTTDDAELQLAIREYIATQV